MCLSIKVPSSSANLGPGFDVFGLALASSSDSLIQADRNHLTFSLELQVKSSPESSETPFNCEISCEGQGADDIKLTPDKNLITQVALYILRCNDQRCFPHGTKVHIINGIPLSRGLGSSGAAVVAGVMLGNEVGKLGLSKDRILDYCLMVERHPDNVAAALFGGFVGSFLRGLKPEDVARKEIPLSEVLPQPAGGENTGKRPQQPPEGIGSYHKLRWAPEIKAVVVIPNFEVETAEARGALPSQYSREDVTFNMQRSSLLPFLLSESPPNASKISEAMRDKIHQPYRQKLIPGLAEVLEDLNPDTHEGLLGVCLSGAGPTILALATRNFENIANAIIEVISKAKDTTCQWQVLEPVEDGATAEILEH